MCLKNLPPIPKRILKIITLKNSKIDHHMKYNDNQPFINGSMFTASIIDFKLLSSGKDVKQIYEIWFDSQESSIESFEPGDTIGILAPNRKKEVDRLISRLDWNERADLLCDIVSLEEGPKKKIPLHLPTSGASIRLILTYFLELRAVLKKQIIRALCEYTSEENERSLLEEYCTNEYENEIIAKHYTFWDLLERFPSCQPPMELILEHLPRLRPRPYSIASSPMNTNRNAKHFRVIFTLEEFGENQTGLTTGWLKDNACLKNKNIDGSLEEALENLTITTKVPMYFRKIPKPFRLPIDQSKNIIMIGSGTGIAPFIGFLEHRAALKQSKDMILGEAWLFYGCRYKERDEIFRREIDDFLKNNILNRFFISYSRENENLKYVQDNIFTHKEEFIDYFLNKETYIYVCGDANKMCKDIYQVIIKVIENVKGIQYEESKILIDTYKKNGFYIEDIWL